MTTGVLLLHGSSRKPDLDRARILQAEGYDVLAPQWFGEAIREIPLESFPIGELAARNDRVVVMGTSRGAEAALLLGTVDTRIDAVIAVSPAAHTWAWIEEDEQQASAWTWQGDPLPFVPFDLTWRPTEDPPSYVGMYRQSLAAHPAEAAAAQIQAERFTGELLLLAGDDDRVWPSVEFAEHLVRRRAGLPTQLLIGAQAGHRPVFPGEEPKSAGQRMARGGTEAADRAFGGQAWADVLKVLQG